MNAWWAAALAGAVCGLLSGLGIGGGTLLMLWMTGVAALPQQTAQDPRDLRFYKHFFARRCFQTDGVLCQLQKLPHPGRLHILSLIHI